MVLKKGNYIFIAVTTWGWTDDALIKEIFGFLPPDKETHMIGGSEGRILWSKTKLSNDTYYSAIDASVRLHKLSDELDFTVTNYGDIIIYRTTNCSYTPQEVLDSYNRYISSKFFIREEKEEDKKMGRILHEGEYILLSGKITVETQFIGYSILSHIGINTSKVNYIGSTRHFLTYAVIEDLELPFNNSRWQDFEIKSTRFHAYTHNFKNLILMEHDECCFDYFDETNEFFEKKEKEKKEKENMSNNKFMVDPDVFATNCDWNRRIDNVIFADNRAYMAATQSVPDKLPDITLEDLRIESSVRAEPLIRGTFRVSPGIIRETRRFQFTQYADSLHCKPFITMPRNLGRSAAMSMLNSIYGLNPNFNGGLLNWNTWCYEFKLYFGVERATGKQKTVCLWKDGEKTIIRGGKSVLSMPVQYAVAWCYVKRRFKTTSAFKKYVDDHSFVMDGMTYFEGDARVKGAQASANNRTKKYDIYDASALAITAKHYGSVKTIMNYCDGWGE